MGRAKTTDTADTGGRSRLLAAAMRLFGSKGYAGTSVRDILKAANVTAPALYYHFGNKEGLFIALAREGIAKLDAAREAALAGDGGSVEKIRRFCLANVAVRREFADLALVVETILTGPPEAAPSFDFRAEFIKMFNQLKDLVQEGVDIGELRPCNPTHAALVLLGFMEVASRPRLAEVVGLRVDAEIEGTLTVILGGLTASGR
jgi:TetR/AcrR family transcriptional regulator